jgi:three-Cys-motif partner protein
MDDGKVGPWAKKKLQQLGDYLAAYAVIMAKQVQDGWCQGFHFVDAFAGPGLHKVRSRKSSDPLQQAFAEVQQYASQYPEQQEYLAGSPRVALATVPPFTTCTFVEKSPDRVAQLQMLNEEYPSRDIRIRQSDCNAYLRQVVTKTPQFWKRNRAVIFLDPFGMQVPWSTIELLGATQAIDVLINFPVGMAIQRLLLRSGEFSASERQKLDNYFGSDEWLTLLYKKSPNLWGEEQTEKIESSGKALVDWYRGRLKTAFGNASRAGLIRNTRKAHLYYLILASPKPIAAKIANEILKSD